MDGFLFQTFHHLKQQFHTPFFNVIDQILDKGSHFPANNIFEAKEREYNRNSDLPWDYFIGSHHDSGWFLFNL
jgi:hypothetical protein